MNTEISNNIPSLHEDYLKIYRKVHRSNKYALTLKVFSKRLKEGKTIVIGNTEFETFDTLNKWLNHEAAMLAAHG